MQTLTQHQLVMSAIQVRCQRLASKVETAEEVRHVQHIANTARDKRSTEPKSKVRLATDCAGFIKELDTVALASQNMDVKLFIHDFQVMLHKHCNTYQLSVPDNVLPIAA